MAMMATETGAEDERGHDGRAGRGWCRVEKTDGTQLRAMPSSCWGDGGNSTKSTTDGWQFDG